MTDKPTLVTNWLAQAWKWSIVLGALTVLLWLALPIAVVLAFIGHGWRYPGGIAAVAFACTVLVQGLRVGVLCATCLQTIAGYDAPKSTDEAPPIAGAGG